MSTIRYIAVHHTGGTQGDPFASTRGVTWRDINRFHRSRWNDESEMGYYGGYNTVYDPKTRSFHQFRKIGEQTIAQRGHNHDAFSLAIIGNYTQYKGRLVDVMHPYIEQDIADFLFDLIQGNKRGLQVKEGTTLDFSLKRIYPHRFLQKERECYGTGLDDSWARNLVTEKYVKRISLLKKIVSLYMKIIDMRERSKAERLASQRDFRACPGLLPSNII